MNPSRMAPQKTKARSPIEIDCPCRDNIAATDLGIEVLLMDDDYALSHSIKIGNSGARLGSGTTLCSGVALP
jgi:hypothetical protein